MMKALGTVSLLQLVFQLIGARKAIREQIPYDVPIGRGKPEDVERDMWNMGSALSAPWPMLAAQAACTVLVLARPRIWVRRAVGCVGALYVFGILWELSLIHI